MYFALGVAAAGKRFVNCWGTSCCLFAYEDKELTEIYKDIETAVTSDQAGSAFEGKKVQMYFQCRNKDQHYP